MCPKSTIKNNDRLFVGDDPLGKVCPKATIKKYYTALHKTNDQKN